MKRFAFLLSATAATGLAMPAFAATSTITDTTPGSANNDGTVNSGEYVGSTNGINNGFGDVIGDTSTLLVDSSAGGSLNFGFQSTGDFNDSAVIYIDSTSGGLNDTTTIEDTSDAGRRAISGDGSDNGNATQSEITFASGFNADYAVSVANNFAGLYQINSDGSLTFSTSGNLSISGMGQTSDSDREVNFSLSDIGISAGDSFDYVGTYLNSGNAFRSNEFQGVVDSSAFDDNIGNNPVSLAEGDFNTFNTVPEPASLALMGVGGLLLIGRRRRR